MHTAQPVEMKGGGGAERPQSDNKCLELDAAASRQWDSIRRAERLATDTDVARLLLSLYRGPGCQRCSMSLPIPRLCTHCRSHQPLGPSADSDNTPLPGRGSGTQHNTDNNVSGARKRSELMLAPSGPEGKKSKRTSDSVGPRTLQVRLKRCDSLRDANGTASTTPGAPRHKHHATSTMPRAGSLGRKNNTLLGQEGAPVTTTDVDICCLKTNMHSAVLGDGQSRMSSEVSQDTVCLCVKTDLEFFAKAEQNQSNSFDPHMGQDTKCEILKQEPVSEDKRNWALEGTLQAALFSDIIKPESKEISVPQTPTGNANRLSNSDSYLKQNEALKQSISPTATNSSSSSTSTWKVRRQDGSLTLCIHRTESSMAEVMSSSNQEHAEQDTNLKPSDSSRVEVSHTEQDTNLKPSDSSRVEVSHTEQDTNLKPSESSGVEVSHTEQDTNLKPSESSGVEVSHTEQDTNLKPSDSSGVEVSHTEQDTNLKPSDSSGVEVSHTEQDTNLEHSKNNGLEVPHQRRRSQRGAPVSYADCDSESSSSSWGTGHSDVDNDTDIQLTDDEQFPQQSLSACGTRGQVPVIEMMSSALNEVTSTEIQQHIQRTKTLMSAPLSKKGKRGQESAIETMKSTVQKGLHTEEKQPVQYLSDTVTPTSLEEIADTEQQPVNEGESKSPQPSLQTAAQDPLECEPQAPASSQSCQATDERTGKCKSPAVLSAKPSEPRPQKQTSKGSTSHQAEGNQPAESDSCFLKCPKRYQHTKTWGRSTPCSAMLTSLCGITKHKWHQTKTNTCRVLYFCNFCSKTYKNYNYNVFLEHKKRHLQINGVCTRKQENSQHAPGEETITSRRRARCEQCGLSCEPEQNIDGAKRDVTETTKCLKCRTMCPTCLMCMTKGSDLATHQDTNIVGRCTVCNSLHTSLCQIRSHTRKHKHEMEAKRKGLMRYLCKMCDMQYMCWGSLRYHRQTRHAAERSHRRVHLKSYQGLVQPIEKK